MKGHVFEGFACIKNQVLPLIFIKYRLRNNMIKPGLLIPQDLYNTIEAQWEMFYCFPSLISSHFIS